jgi:hypothetical protein
MSRRRHRRRRGGSATGNLLGFLIDRTIIASGAARQLLERGYREYGIQGLTETS